MRTRRVDISDALQARDNLLEVEIVNRWPNRLLGDQQKPDKNVRTLQWDEDFLGGREYKAGRYTFSSSRRATKKLLPSGLLGPVRIMEIKNE